MSNITQMPPRDPIVDAFSMLAKEAREGLIDSAIVLVMNKDGTSYTLGIQPDENKYMFLGMLLEAQNVLLNGPPEGYEEEV